MSERWLQALREACARESQSAVASRIRYSNTTVSQVLGGTYKGSLKAVQTAVEGALLSEVVDCPIFPEPIRKDACLNNQQSPRRATADPVAAALRGTCPSCPNRLGGSHA